MSYGLAAILCCLSTPCSLMAQGQDANHNWIGNSVSSVTDTNDSDMKTVYLYNVGTGKFLNVGSYWGTSVSAYNVGMPIEMTQNGSKYKMKGPLRTPQGENIAFCRRTDTRDGNRVSWNRVYCDRGNEHFYPNHVNGILDWTFDETYPGSKTYTIHCFNTETTEGMYGNRYLRVINRSSTGSNRLELDYPSTGDGENAQWKIITLKDLKDAFKEQYASDEDPADATFLVQDQDFNRSNVNVSAWKSQGFTYNMTTNNTYLFYAGSPYTYYVGIGDRESNAYQRQYGRYWIGSVRNLNNTAHANGTLTQTVTTLKKGWYKVSCDGFYSPGTMSSSLKSSLIAKVQGQTSASESNVAVELTKFQRDFSYTTNELTTEYNGFNENYPETPYIKAAKLFEQGKYTNSIMVYVPNDGDRLDIGIKVEGSNNATDWTAFDNFQLQYCGNRDLILDEMQTSVDYMDLQADPNNAYTLILKRSLTTNIWNSITLPVNLTAAQFKTAFGSDSKLSKLVGQDPNKATQILFKSVSLANDNDTVIEAGKIYIIKPTRDASVTNGSYNKRLKDERTVITVDAPYYVINNVTLAVAPEPIVKEESKPSTTSDVKLQFCGTQVRFDNDVVPASSYVLGTDGKWYFTQSDLPIKGFRSWIATGGSADAKMITFAIDDVDYGSTTAIEGINANTSVTETGNVYNMNGQVVRRNATNVEGLPKGIYIFNHRKIVVR